MNYHQFVQPADFIVLRAVTQTFFSMADQDNVPDL